MPLYYIRLIPNYIFKSILIIKEKGISYPTSKNLLLAVDGDHYKKITSATMKRLMLLRNSSPNGSISNTTTAPKSQEISWERG